MTRPHYIAIFPNLVCVYFKQLQNKKTKLGLCDCLSLDTNKVWQYVKRNGFYEDNYVRVETINATTKYFVDGVEVSFIDE